MGSCNNARAFHPLDLEIIDRVYEAAWAALQARDPFGDPDKDGERQDGSSQAPRAINGRRGLPLGTLLLPVRDRPFVRGNFPRCFGRCGGRRGLRNVLVSCTFESGYGGRLVVTWPRETSYC
jgi:hypothetical protein